MWEKNKKKTISFDFCLPSSIQIQDNSSPRQNIRSWGVWPWLQFHRTRHYLRNKSQVHLRCCVCEEYKNYCLWLKISTSYFFLLSTKTLSSSFPSLVNNLKRSALSSSISFVRPCIMALSVQSNTIVNYLQ